MTRPPTAGARLRRGLTRRCAACGGGNLFDGWYRMRSHCPTCGVRFQREEGFFASAVFVNLAITEVLLFVWIAVGFLATLPEPPVLPLVAGAVAICVVVPLVFYPFSKTIWFAVHLAMQPLDPDEEAEAAAVRFERGDGGLRR